MNHPPPEPEENGSQNGGPKNGGQPIAVRVLNAKVAGRARLRVFGLKGRDGLARRLEESLPTQHGIREIRANPLTGTALVRYDQDCQLEDIVERVSRQLGNTPKHQTRPKRQHPQADRPPAKTKPHSRRQNTPVAVPKTAHRQKVWHAIPADDVLADLQSDGGAGLSETEAQARLQRLGPNVLRETPPPSKLGLLLDQVASPPVALLGVSALVSVATGGLVDAIAIAAVVGINTAIGYLTESQADSTIRSLTKRVERATLVRRCGAQMEIPAADVVPGDVMVLAPGMFIAADARVIGSSDLTVDESMLTGESLPVQKIADTLSRAKTPLADRRNMIYKGTLVTGGGGLAVVVATGKDTEIGAIQSLVGEARAPETPMQRQLGDLGLTLAVVSGGVCAATFAVGLMRGYGFVEMLKASTALAVAAVPEGLPAVATTTLALGIRDMRKQKVLVRRLEAVETLGSVGMICFDKTGTLTLNRMTVTDISLGGVALQAPDGDFSAEDVAAFDMIQALKAAVLCNDARVSEDGGHIVGSATEAAMVRAALEAGIDVATLRNTHPRTYSRLRSELRNTMLTHHDTPEGHRLEVIKGAPTEVLENCRWQMRAGVRVPLDAEDRDAIAAENDRMAGQALRVLGLAMHSTVHNLNGDDTNGDDEGYTWMGLIGMADPVRPGMHDLMGVFHGAGIRTVMITGDQSATAYAIAKQLALTKDGPVSILDSTRLDGVEPELLAALTGKADVFARVSPAHKLQIVQGLQKGGQVVAMTGDGINDGPALKAADIGIAMGETGSDVAHELADVILQDDNIETMAKAVAQGRTIYTNIRKSLHFLLATNLSEVAVVFGSTALGMGQPLTPMQLLWINLVSDIFPGLALSLEPPDKNVLSRPPRDPNEPIVRKPDLARMGVEGAVISAGAMGAYGIGLLRYGPGAQASTMAFYSLTTAQLLHTLSCRSDHHRAFSRTHRYPENRMLTWALAGSLGATALSAVFPPLRRLLGVAPIGALDFAVTAGAAVLPFIVNESLKPTMSRLLKPARIKDESGLVQPFIEVEPEQEVSS